MYIRVSYRRNPETGNHEGYYRLIESYRNHSDRVCHRTIMNIGFWDCYTPDQLRKVQLLLREKIAGPALFNFAADEDVSVISAVDHLFNRLVDEKRIDIDGSLDRKKREREEKRGIHRIVVETIRSKDVREIGAENLCFQTLKQLQVPDLLRSLGWGEEQVQLATTQIIARTVYPSSEFEASRWIKENSALCEVTGYPIEKLTKDKLYGMSKQLFSIKSELESHLSQRTNTLFDLNDSILLYDLTNTYFEGSMRNSKIAKHGRSKEKRSDARLIVLALVVNAEGFIKYSSLFEGNMSDAKSLGSIVDGIDKQINRKPTTKPLVVMDAGIATEDNLKMLQEKGYNYLCVSRSSAVKYSIDNPDSLITVYDNKKQPIELSRVKANNQTDYYLRIHSQNKEVKEKSMNQLFAERYESELQKIALSIERKHGTKLLDKVNQRIGRAQQKYPSIHRFYEIGLTTDENTETPKVVQFTYKRKEGVDMNQRSGIYFLRTNLTNPDERFLWQSYNCIREIESTFRCLKTDLDLRPIYHKKDESAMAHLHLGLLAYWVVNTVRHQLKQKDIKHQWKEVVRIMNTQKAVTTTAQNDQDKIIIIRQCTEPTQKAKELYDALKYKYAPFTKRKSVVHKSEFRE